MGFLWRRGKIGGCASPDRRRRNEREGERGGVRKGGKGKGKGIPKRMGRWDPLIRKHRPKVAERYVPFRSERLAVNMN